MSVQYAGGWCGLPLPAALNWVKMFRIVQHSARVNVCLRTMNCKRFTTEAPKSRREQIKEKERKKLLYVGLPLVAFVFGGTYFLSIFMDTKMEVKDRQMGKSTSIKKFDLEEEHKALMEKLKIDDFSLSRIPRPEEGKEAKNNDILHILVNAPERSKKEK